MNIKVAALDGPIWDQLSHRFQSRNVFRLRFNTSALRTNHKIAYFCPQLDFSQNSVLLQKLCYYQKHQFLKAKPHIFNQNRGWQCNKIKFRQISTLKILPNTNKYKNLEQTNRLHNTETVFLLC